MKITLPAVGQKWINDIGSVTQVINVSDLFQRKYKSIIETYSLNKYYEMMTTFQYRKIN